LSYDKKGKQTGAADSFMEHFEFEMALYEKIAGTRDFEILFMPDENGVDPSEIEIEVFLKECKAKKLVPVIKWSDGKTSVVFSNNTDSVGIISDNSLHGFEC
jgi:hypothetical protein